MGHHGAHGHARPGHAVDPVRVVVHARVHARIVGQGALVAVGHHALDGPLARRTALTHERSARVALAGVAAPADGAGADHPLRVHVGRVLALAQ